MLVEESQSGIAVPPPTTIQADIYRAWQNASIVQTLAQKPPVFVSLLTSSPIFIDLHALFSSS